MLQLIEKVAESTEVCESVITNAVWIEVHYIVANITDTFELLDKLYAIDSQFEFEPAIRVFEQSDVLPKREIRGILDHTLRIGRVLCRGQIFTREVRDDQGADTVFNVAEQKKRLRKQVKLLRDIR